MLKYIHLSRNSGSSRGSNTQAIDKQEQCMQTTMANAVKNTKVEGGG